ncbi:MAG: nicotinate-nucleotide adenylyltransferase [Micrococcales bacterium]
MAKLAVFGGTFDPIHNGHLVAAREVVNKLHLEKLLFVPTGDSYQKDSNTSALHRAQMVRLAIQGNSNFEIDLSDVNRTGPTYTIDTLREIKTKYPSDDLFFVLGSDAFAGIETWKNYRELFDLAIFVIVTRPNFAVQVPTELRHRVMLLEIDALNLSSTEVRTRLANHQDVNALLPDKVANYIEVNNLYEVNA